MWEPEWLSIDDMMSPIAGVVPCDKMRLITELFVVYRRYHKSETFDKFYFWGEVLLKDFDQIDKYRIDAEMLFRNVSELKDLESDLSFLTEEQREVVRLFWHSFDSAMTGADGASDGASDGVNDSDYTKKFQQIWSSLADIYREYTDRLKSLGVGYTGLIHRLAADKIKQCSEVGAIGEPLFDCSVENPYVIIGFNALSECEKVLFRELQRCGALFYWDYDNYYCANKAQEAGLFIRKNIELFPEAKAFNDPTVSATSHDNLAASHGNSQSKNIEVVACSSNVLQCKHVAEIFRSKRIAGVDVERINSNTAVVLTDESLLTPLLYALPGGEGSKFNVTMGHPLRQSLAYSFVERLLLLQGRSKVGSFYHIDVVGLLRHPYLNFDSKVSGDIIKSIENEHLIQVPATLLVGGSELMQLIFTHTKDWESYADYLISVLKCAIDIDCGDSGLEADQRVEFLHIFAEHLVTLRNSIASCNDALEGGESPIELTKEIFVSLLRRTLQSLRIPYESDPLDVPQVMGILETRTLDFENVIILSMNDENFPGNRFSEPSYVPYNLRFGYGMPTPEHHDGVYAYYFYRLISRAKNITMLYCSKADDKSTGEQSRYITQLEFESGIEIKRRELGVDAGIIPKGDLVISKSDDFVRERLQRYFDSDKTKRRRLSATTLFRYVACPMRFYFGSVADIYGDSDEVSDDVDVQTFGKIMHKALEILYSTPSPFTLGDLQGVTAQMIDDAVKTAIAEEINVKDSTSYNGDLVLVYEVIKRYVRNIIDYDINSGIDFKVIGNEVKFEHDLTLMSGATITLKGLCDRVDELNGGSTLRIVDYKSGKAHCSMESMESTFNGNGEQRQSNIFQTLLYSYIYSRKADYSAVVPVLYGARNIHTPGYSSLLENKRGDHFEVKDASGNVTSNIELPKGPLESYTKDYDTLFTHYFHTLLEEIFDLDTPFTKCADRENTCKYCDYTQLCGEKHKSDDLS